MAQVQSTTGNGDNVTGFQLDDFGAIGYATIPGLQNATVGWYRIADIDATGLSGAPYRQVFIMGGGAHSTGTPTNFAVVATLPAYDSGARVRIKQLTGNRGTNYTKLRFSIDGSIVHIDLYLAVGGGTGSRGAERILVAAVGGKLKTYTPTSPVTETPATILATHTFEDDDFTYSGAYKFSLANVVSGGAGWYRVATIPLAIGNNASQTFHAVGEIYYTGWYSGFKPTKGVFAFTYDGGSSVGNIVELSGVASTAPTQIRIIGSTYYMAIELYFPSITAAGAIHEIAVRALGVRGVEYQDPVLTSSLASGEAVRASMTIKTIASGAVTTSA